MDREELIEQLVLEQAARCGTQYQGPLERSTELLRIGLDSLGFVTLTVTLEQRLGIDPFASTDAITYPETYGELLDLYAETPAGP